MNRFHLVALLTNKYRAVARQNAEGVPGLAGGSFCPCLPAGRLTFLVSFFALRQRMKWGSGQSPG